MSIFKKMKTQEWIQKNFPGIIVGIMIILFTIVIVAEILTINSDLETARRGIEQLQARLNDEKIKNSQILAEREREFSEAMEDSSFEYYELTNTFLFALITQERLVVKINFNDNDNPFVIAFTQYLGFTSIPNEGYVKLFNSIEGWRKSVEYPFKGIKTQKKGQINYAEAICFLDSNFAKELRSENSKN